MNCSETDVILGAGLVLATGLLLVRKLIKRRRDAEKGNEEVKYRKRMSSDKPQIAKRNSG